MPEDPTSEPGFRSASFRFLDEYFPALVDAIAWMSGGAGYRNLSRLHRALSASERVDLIPFDWGRRGFVVLLDHEVALHFTQDGDGFAYAGYDTGDFDAGDVTLFDDLPGKETGESAAP